MQKPESPILKETRLDPWKAAKQQLQLVGQLSPEAHLGRWVAAVQEAGPVEVNLTFGWGEQKRIRVHGTVSASATVQCQRCLRNMPLELHSAIDAAVVFSEESAAQLPTDLDPWLGCGDQLDLAHQIEEELLLALPIMPVHEQESCTGKSHFSTGDNIEESSGKRAFSELADLIKKSNN